MSPEPQNHSLEGAPESAIHSSQGVPRADSQIKRWVILLGGAFILVLIGVWTLRTTEVRTQLQERLAERQQGVPVKTAIVTVSKDIKTLSLTGEVRPFAEVTLYAKVSGYLKSVLVDKGDNVKKNQVLAVIDSVETDQAYAGARADYRNKSNISKRTLVLLERGLVSNQEAETAVADAEVARSKLKSSQIFKDYEKIIAPFDGVVTSRFADPGALVQNAMASQSSALPVLTVAQIDRVRIYVYVDQQTAQLVTVGAKARVYVGADSAGGISAKVSRVSGDLDTRTRMLLVEIDLDNSKRTVLAGSFVQVKLNLTTAPSLAIPVEALISRDGQSYAAIIGDDQLIHYRVIKIAVNDGKTVGVLSGLQAGEQVALNVGNSLLEGSRVWVK